MECRHKWIYPESELGLRMCKDCGLPQHQMLFFWVDTNVEYFRESIRFHRSMKKYEQKEIDKRQILINEFVLVGGEQS